MKGEYISIKTLRQLKKQRDNMQTSALQLDKIVKEKQKEIDRLNNIRKEVREYAKEIIEAFEEVNDKDLITNRVVDISVIEKFLELLDKGE